jgi:signal transduction histidine kinase
MNDALRTPMHALIGAAEHLRRAAASPEARAHIATLAQAGEVLKLVLNDLSDLDQLENGLVRIEAKPADPREIARGVVSAFRAAAQDKHLELFLDVTRQMPASVQIDAPRVRQILFNLLANAVRYTTHGGVRVSVNARASETPNHVRLNFIIADTGAGMSRAQLAQVFGRERVSAEGEGPGLGLAIVDADVRQAFERIGAAVTREHALDDRPDGPPADPHERAERRLVGSLREVRHLLLELVGEP